MKKIASYLLVFVVLTSMLTACNTEKQTDSDAQKLLTDLNNKAKVTVNEPGWVHVTESIVYDTDSKDRGTMANGTIIPLQQTVNIWYHISAEKLVYENVWMMSNPQGETIEVTVFLGNTLFNLTTNISNPFNPYSLSLDHQFIDEMDSFISRGGHPVVSNAVVNGRNATVFTLNEKTAWPQQNSDYTQPFIAAGSIASFDTETGFLLKLVQTITLADGTVRNFYTDNVTIETGVQPTLEVQNYVDGYW